MFGFVVLDVLCIEDIWSSVGSTDQRTLQLTIQALQPAHLYKFKIRSVSDDAGGGSCSAEVAAVTGVLVPVQSSSVVAREIGCEWIDLEWSESADDGGTSIRWHELQYAEEPSISLDGRPILPDFRSTVVPAPSCMFRLAGLSPSTPYVLRVRAINRIGPGEWSKTSDVVRTLQSDAAAPGQRTANHN